MKVFKTTLIVLSAVLVLVGCSNSTNSNTKTGRLNVTMTDAPFPIDLVSEANVTIDKIEIRRDSTEVESSTFLTISEESQTFNLLDLQNGVKTSLVDLEIEEGSYDLIRLYVSEANIVLTDNTTYDLTVPSGAQTGIKVFVSPSIEVVSDLSAELLLDFDVANSFVARGNISTPAGINGFNFKPTIKAVNASDAGRIEGVVADTSLTVLSDVQIAVIADSDTSYAFSNEEGFYSIISLDEGVYTIEATAAGFDTLRANNVAIKAGNTTTFDVELTPSDN
ncbi:MAG: DUF4382 domain-containing protein [Balneolaceae bacterium]|nr:DUF4382 domain-containing protein [Balneolaceae bacterium]